MPLNQQAKKGVTVLAGEMVLITEGDRMATKQKRKGDICLEYRRSLRGSLRITTACK